MERVPVITSPGDRPWVRFAGSVPATCGVIGAGLAIRLVLLWWLYHGRIVSDSQSYHEMAGKLLSGEPFVPAFPPGMSLYLAGAQAVLGQTRLVSELATLLAYVVLSILVYGSGRRLFSAGLANLAVAAFAVYPSCVITSVLPLTQVPTALCLLATVYLALVAARRANSVAASVAGISAAGTALLRPSSLPFVFLVPAYLLARTRKPLLAVLPLAIGSLLVSAWLYKAYRMTGHFIPINTANAFNLYAGNSPYTPLYRTWWLGSHADALHEPAQYRQLRASIRGLPVREQSAAYRRLALEHIRQRPVLFGLRTVNRIRCFFAFDSFAAAATRTACHPSKVLMVVLAGLDAAVYCVLAVLAIVALAAGLGSASFGRPATVALATACLVYAFPYWLSFSHPTYHFPIMPLIALLALGAAGPLAESPGRFVQRVRRLPARRQYLLWAALALFAYIQVEWLVVMSGRL